MDNKKNNASQKKSKNNQAENTKKQDSYSGSNVQDSEGTKTYNKEDMNDCR